MPRPAKHETLSEIIAYEVRRALEEQFGAHPAGLTAKAQHSDKSHAPSDKSAAHNTHATAQSTPNAAANPGPAQAAAATASAGNDIVERVRADLSAAYDGRPVSPDRLAFRLKADRILVDAALTYLCSRKEARAMGARGKIAYVPLRTNR